LANILVKRLSLPNSKNGDIGYRSRHLSHASERSTI
jgi:hypothetical protein